MFKTKLLILYIVFCRLEKQASKQKKEIIFLLLKIKLPWTILLHSYIFSLSFLSVWNCILQGWTNQVIGKIYSSRADRVCVDCCVSWCTGKFQPLNITWDAVWIWCKEKLYCSSSWWLVRRSVWCRAGSFQVSDYYYQFYPVRSCEQLLETKAREDKRNPIITIQGKWQNISCDFGVALALEGCLHKVLALFSQQFLMTLSKSLPNWGLLFDDQMDKFIQIWGPNSYY